MSHAFDLVAPQLCLDMHPLMHRLRREDPVHWSPQLNGWVLTRFEDISSALKDPRITAAGTTTRIDMMPEAERQRLQPLRNFISLWMGHTTREDHLRFVQFLKRYFSGRTVEQLRPKVQALTHSLLDKAVANGEMDFVNAVAHPLSAGVIAQMLGTPTADIDKMLHWSHELNLLFRVRDLEGLLRIQRATTEMSDYLRPIIEARRRRREEDLISSFLDGEAEGTIRSEAEITANCALLLFAGHETTANLLGNGMELLLRYREQREQWRSTPALGPTAIEEILRFDGPAAMINRLAAADLELGGKKIEAHQTIYLVLSAGNRDPAVFPEPDRFDITRKTARHLAFGYGANYCQGAPLARMEAQVCLETVLHRYPDMKPRYETPDWEPLPPLWRRLVSLKVAV
jgi:cytochrome P450